MILFKYNGSFHSWLQRLLIALEKISKKSTFLIKILCLHSIPFSSTSTQCSLFGSSCTSILSFQHQNTDTPSQPSQDWCLCLDCLSPVSIRLAFLDHLGLLLKYSKYQVRIFFKTRRPTLHSLIWLFLSYMQLPGFNILIDIYFAFFYYTSLEGLYDLILS